MPAPFAKFPAFLNEMHERYGNVVAFSLPWRSFVMLNEPDAIKELLVTQQHAFSKSQGARALRSLLGNGLLTSEEPQHRQMRRIVQPAFHRERIAAYAREIQRIVDEWIDARRDGEVLAMSDAMSELTLRIASTTLFGADASGDAAQVRAALHETMQTFPSAIGPLGALRRNMRFLSSTKRFERARTQLDAILYRLIEQRRRNPGSGDDALAMLLEAEDAQTGYRLSDEQVRDEAMTLFLAGHETTANALFWTWYLLAKHPEAEQQFHDALDAGDGEVAKRYMRESMRLYPPAWIIGREAQRDVELCGKYPIAANTTVFVCQLVLHRSTEYYDEPLAFTPQRWLREDAVPQFAYVPFGGGARRCIGEEFAWMEGAMALSAIGRRLRFRMMPEHAGEPGFDALVTLRPRTDVPMRVEQRAPASVRSKSAL